MPLRGYQGDEVAEIFVQMGDHIRLDGMGTPAALLVIRDGWKRPPGGQPSGAGHSHPGQSAGFIRQGLADAGAKSLNAHRLSRTSAI